MTRHKLNGVGRLVRTGWLLTGILILLCYQASAALVLTNISVVNVTPGSFSIVGSASVAPTISVFADSGGASNLAGQVGIEFYPLYTGDPRLTNSYDRRLNQATLRQKTANQGLVQIRVSDCSPGTTYYYRLQVTNNSGQQVVWPASGLLPGVTTARENSFVIQSRQLVLDLPGVDPSGAIITLSNKNTGSLLASVAGDGVLSNQVYFSVNDLIAASGDTNFLPLGNQDFIAEVLGSSTSTILQTYTLNFTTDFLIGQENEFTLGNFAVVSIGSTVQLAGASGSLPVGLYASGITNLTFVLNLTTNRFSSLSLQALSPQLSLATLQSIGSNSLLASFRAVTGQTLAGNQEIAQLNFTTVSNQSSAFIPFAPQSLVGVNVDGSFANNLAVQSGRLVVIANEPLLEAALVPGIGRSLVLYGKPWSSYEIQSTTNLAQPAAWSDWRRVPMTNLMAVFSGLDISHPSIFYRAYEFTANPPLLEAQLVNQNRSILTYGIPGTNYLVQYSTNLSGVVAWHPLLSYTLTNSFQLITNIGNSNPLIFYRLRKQ